MADGKNESFIDIELKDYGWISDSSGESAEKIKDILYQIEYWACQEELNNPSDGQEIIHVIYPKEKPKELSNDLDNAKKQKERENKRKERNWKFRLYGDLGQNRMNGYIGTLHFQEFDYQEADGMKKRILNKYTLNIKSRFDEDDNRFFSQYILSKTLANSSYIFGKYHGGAGNIEFLEPVIAVAFVQKINQAFKKGAYRTYREYERNNPKARGRIDVARHIKQNPLFSGNIAYTCREFTVDNDINLLALTTYKMLEKKYPWLRNALRNNRSAKDYVDQMSKIITPASRTEIRSIIKRNTKKITHPIYHDWEEVRRMAIMIQRMMGNFIGNSNAEEMPSVLIDMNRAWEIYLEQIFRQSSSDSSYELKAQEDIEVLFLDGKGHGERTMRPDFFWEKKNPGKDDETKAALVLDAKNKPAWRNVLNDNKLTDSSNAGKEERLREDILELFFYMERLDCKLGGIICPFTPKDKPDPSNKSTVQKIGPYRLSKAKHGEKSFYVLGLPVAHSDIENFKDYAEIMASREKSLNEIIDYSLLGEG